MDCITILKEHNIAITELRLDMLDILISATKPVSFEDFDFHANKTTFYRNMELFEKEGIVTKTEIHRKFFYELAERTKAHFVCDVCHKITDFIMPEVNDKESTGRIKSVLAKGICQDCDIQ
ncbi:Fur family transcriptional regulator [Helicobacter aurati]|uniref:Fur family transcriptional regulator n=1 Tax=Helicobacter aurati TaxID=137778 RepID=A0A3D8J8G8_9HELI|nr:transcriptional repressor [Helicobacter aurati]RDU73793.1 Fur family transcriptional regulator [Helicobacter aurati]